MKILIVDDSMEDIHYLRKCLKVQNPPITIVTANSYKEGLDQAIKETPDCIFLDYRLPGGLTGLDLVHDLNRNKVGAAIIAISEFHDQDLPSDFAKEGAIDFLFKESITAENIRAYIVNAIQKRSIFKKLVEQSAKNNDYISHLSHDIRSPLSSIYAIASLAVEEECTKEELIEYFRHIHKTSFNALEMAEDILEISRFEQLGLSLNLIETSFSDFMVTEFNRLLPIGNQKGIVFINEIEPNLTCSFDPKSMRLVISNLVSNALKFTPKNKSISLIAKKTDQGLYVAVKDEGIGISADILPKLFKKDELTTKTGIYGEKGTGLGLPFIAEIITAHDSTIEVDSDENGSNFYFKLQY